MDLGKVKKGLALAGLLLLGSNVAGRFLPLRNRALLDGKPLASTGETILSERQVNEIVADESGGPKRYVERVNDAVNRGIAHTWDDEGIDEYRLRIPFTENYLLFFASFVYPPEFRKYEFCRYDKALERGVGFCSQYAAVAAGILESRGIPSRIVRLSGHVVATAEVDREKGSWWILDPNLGVVIPHDIGEIEKNPGIVREYYGRKGFDDRRLADIEKVYAKEGNRVLPANRRCFEPTRHGLKCCFEALSYVLIWVIPVLLAAPWAWSALARARRRV